MSRGARPLQLQVNLNDGTSEGGATPLSQSAMNGIDEGFAADIFESEGLPSARSGRCERPYPKRPDVAGSEKSALESLTVPARGKRPCRIRAPYIPGRRASLKRS